MAKNKKDKRKNWPTTYYTDSAAIIQQKKLGVESNSRYPEM